MKFTIRKNPGPPKQNAPGTSPPAAPAAPKAPTPPATASPAQPKAPPAGRLAAERGVRFDELKVRIHRTLVDKLDLTALDGEDTAEMREMVRGLIAELADQENALLSFAERNRLIGEVMDETFGLGPLEALLKDPDISDILINGPHNVYIEKHGRLQLTEVRFKDNSHLLHVLDKIVSAVGRRCDETSPMVDARLEDGSRVNAIIPPLALDGASVSIRRFGAKIVTWEDYIGWKSCTQEMRDFLEACVKGALNVLIVGGTGSGKTTLLNNCSRFIPEEDRIVTIEDAAELQLQQPHVVRLETRPANVEGKGKVTIRELLMNSLRMRPDRIVVGECRGAETLDMLQAMNTGHDGSLTTIHANSTRDAVQRVETMVMMAGFELPLKAIRQQFASAIDVVVYAARLTGGPRKICNVTEVQGMEGEIITMQDIFQFQQEGINAEGKAFGTFYSTGLRPNFLDRLKAHGAEVRTEMFERRALMSDMSDE